MESATALTERCSTLSYFNDALLYTRDLPSVKGMSDLLAVLERHMLERALRMREGGEAHRQRMAAEVRHPSRRH